MISIRHDRARRPAPGARIIQQKPAKLSAIVDQACKAAGVAPSRFGRDAIGDPALVQDLRAGRTPRARTRALILAHVERIGAEAVRP